MSKIVIGCDLSKHTKQTLNTGIHWAEKLSLEPLVLHGEVIAGYPAIDILYGERAIESSPRGIDELLKVNRATLESYVEKVATTIKNIKVESRSGSAEDVLINAAQDSDVALLVLGYRPDKMHESIFLGRISETVFHRANKPALIVKKDLSELNKILVAYDFSHYSDLALGWAEHLASKFKAEIEVIYVKTDKQSNCEEKLHQRVSPLQDKGIKVEFKVLEKQDRSIVDTILEYQEQVANSELLIVGTHGKGKIKELFLGSVALKLIRRSKSSVLIAK